MPFRPGQRSSGKRTARWIECCLWAIGFACAGYYGYVWVAEKIAQDQGERELDRLLGEAPSGNQHAVPRHTRLIGRLEIPRIGISAIVFEGDDAGTLQLGIGHLRGSAMPGKSGNVVLAAHRDTFFRPLQGIREPDVIRLTTADGTHTYVVQSTSVVDPDRITVLNPTPRPTLTLVTCFPFNYIGSAPQRFIVQARESSDEDLAPTKPVVSSVSRRRAKTPRAPPVQLAVQHLEPEPSVSQRDDTWSPVSSPAPAVTLIAQQETVLPGADRPRETQRHRAFRWIKPRGLVGKLRGVVHRPEND